MNDSEQPSSVTISDDMTVDGRQDSYVPGCVTPWAINVHCSLEKDCPHQPVYPEERKTVSRGWLSLLREFENQGGKKIGK